jgi:WD40 repeat protein
MDARNLIWCITVFTSACSIPVLADEPTKQSSDAPTTNFGRPLPDYLRQLTKEELDRTKRERDDSGAKYRVHEELADDSNLLGRTIFISNADLSEFLSFRGHILGLRGVGLAMPIEHAIKGPFEKLVCIAGRDANGNQSPDLLYYDFFLPPIPGVPKQYRLQGHLEPPWYLRFSQGGDRLVSCSDDGSIRLWDLDSQGRTTANPNCGKDIDVFPGYTEDKNGNNVRGDFVAFSPYGRWLVTAFEHKVWFRSPRDGSERFTWEPDQAVPRRIMAVRFDPHGNNLYAFLEHKNLTANDQVKFFGYDIDQRDSWPFEGKHGVVDGRATIDGKYVITWDGSPEIVFWDAIEHREIAALKVAPEHVYDVAISPMGDVVATAGDDGELKFWKTEDRKRLDPPHPIKHDRIRQMEFGEYGQWLVTCGADGWRRAWDTPEFFWSKHFPGHWGKGSLDGSFTQSWNDSVTVTDKDGNITETFPDGTVNHYKQQ